MIDWLIWLIVMVGLVNLSGYTIAALFLICYFYHLNNSKQKGK